MDLERSKETELSSKKLTCIMLLNVQNKNLTCSQRKQVSDPALPLSCHETLGNSLNLSYLQYIHLLGGGARVLFLLQYLISSIFTYKTKVITVP